MKLTIRGVGSIKNGPADVAGANAFEFSEGTARAVIGANKRVLASTEELLAVGRITSAKGFPKEGERNEN